MTGGAPEDETGRAPTDTPAQGSQVAGGHGRGQDDPLELGTVQIAYLHGGTVSHSWHQSLLNAIAYDKAIGQDVIASLPYAVSCSGPNSLVEGRNMAVKHFLDETDAQWLMFIDTDMGFQADAIERLLVAARFVERPVIGGLCFALKHMKPDGMGGFNVLPVPTLFEWARNEDQGLGFANRFRYPPESIVKVAGTGAAFLLINRWVLDRLRNAYGDRWFDFVQYGDGVQVSEDLSFCWRLAEQEIPVHVHTGIKVSHHKQFWLSEADYHMPHREPMAPMIEAAGGKGPCGQTWGGEEDAETA